MDNTERETIIRQDIENGALFDIFLEQINNENKEYFDKRIDRFTDIKECFALLSGWRPPFYKLRYIGYSELDTSIKDQVIKKYQELFGSYADYAVIER